MSLRFFLQITISHLSWDMKFEIRYYFCGIVFTLFFFLFQSVTAWLYFWRHENSHSSYSTNPASSITGVYLSAWRATRLTIHVIIDTSILLSCPLEILPFRSVKHRWGGQVWHCCEKNDTKKPNHFDSLIYSWCRILSRYSTCVKFFPFFIYCLSHILKNSDFTCDTKSKILSREVLWLD